MGDGIKKDFLSLLMAERLFGQYSRDVFNCAMQGLFLNIIFD